MMIFAEDLTLIEIFMEKAAIRHEARLAEEATQAFADEKRKKEKREEKQERREKEEKELLDQIVMATMAQVETFKVQLDDYDTATVQALMDNGRALDAVRYTREEIEASAYRLTDGRMVFKSDDGKQVFDQHGAEVSRDIIDPHDIPDILARSSAYERIVASESKLTQDRQVLHRFQEKLDDAHIVAGRKGVSADEISGIGDDLQQSVPKSVEALLHGGKPEHPGVTNADALIQMPAAGSGYTDPVRRTGFRPAPM